MTAILAVHGCGPCDMTPQKIQDTWLDGLSKGLSLVGGPEIRRGHITCVSFVDLLMQPWDSTKASTGVPAIVAAARRKPDHRCMASHQWPIRQIITYVVSEHIRHRVRERVMNGLSDRTTMVLAHSLGSVAAYEALAASPGHSVHTLITMGSPLGLPVFLDRLRADTCMGRHAWPAPLRRWINISNARDLIALVSELRPLFGDGTEIDDIKVRHRAKSHNLVCYLNAAPAAYAIARGLRRTPLAWAPDAIRCVPVQSGAR